MIGYLAIYWCSVLAAAWLLRGGPNWVPLGLLTVVLVLSAVRLPR
jgi:hypothetical protein